MNNKNRMILALAAVAMMFAVCFVGFSMVSDDGADAETTYVAKIGETQYETLAAAVDAATTGANTIELLTDFSITDSVTIPGSKSVTIDLKGKIITYTPTTGGAISVSDGASLTITDSTATSTPAVDENYDVTYSSGKIVSNRNGVIVFGSGTFELKSGTIQAKQNGVTCQFVSTTSANITISGGLVNATEFSVVAIGNTTATISGGVLLSTDNVAFGGNGTQSYFGSTGTTMNVTDGTIISKITTSGYMSCGIYQPQKGTLNVSGGKIVAAGKSSASAAGCDSGVGILIRGGKVNISGGEIIATGTAVGKVGDLPAARDASAVYLDIASSYPDSANAGLEITGGTFVSDPKVDAIYVNPSTSAEKAEITKGSFSDLSGLAYAKANAEYKLIADCTIDSDVTVKNSTKLTMQDDVTLGIKSGVKLTIEKDSVFTGKIAGPGNNVIVANGMKAGDGGISITGGSLLINGVIVPEGTSTVAGATITVSGDDITVSGKLDSGAELLVTNDGSTNVVFKDFEQETGTKVEFEKSDGSKTTDPVEAGANISLGKNVTLTDLKYKTKDVTSDFVYTGSAQTPGTNFPGIEANTSYTIESTTIIGKGDYDTDGSGNIIIKPQTNVGTYVIYYLVKVKETSSGTETTYEVKRSWSITPMTVKISGSVTKEYNGNTDFDSTGLSFNPTDKITFVSAGVASKDVGTYDLDLIVSSAVPISNLKIMYGTTVLTPVASGSDYKLVLPGAATITAKALDNSMVSKIEPTYNGSEQEVTITLHDSGILAATDYDLGGTLKAANVNTTADYTATVTGKGNYSGSLSVTWNVVPKTLTDGMATAGALTYDKSSQNVVITVMDGATTLAVSTDYTIAGVTSATDVGTTDYVATVTGTGNYQGAIDVKWNITPKTINDTMVTATSLTYDGTVQDAPITVTDNTYTLVKDTDYMIYSGSATEGKDAGMYLSIINGKGNYTGTVNKTWRIEPKSITDSSISVSDASVTVVNTGATVTMTVKDGTTVLVLGTDYTLVGLVKTGVDKYKVSLNGQGNYVGTKNVTDIPVAKSFYSNGAAFYSDADIARLAMQMSEITYTGPVKDKNIVFVYYQTGFSSSDMYGSLYYKGSAVPVLTTLLDRDDGRQVWLIENDDLSYGFVNGGKYTLKIEEGSTKIFEVDVTVNFPVHPLDYYVIDALDYDYKDYDYVGDLKADDSSVTVTYVSKYMGTKDVMNDFARYMGALYYNSDGEVTSVYFDGNTYTWNDKLVNPDTSNLVKGSRWYDFTNNKTLVSAVVDYVKKNDSTQVVMEISNAYQKQSLVYGAVFMNGHTLGYYVQDALNYVYDGTGYTYKGAFDVDAGNVKVTYVGKPTERATDAMNDFARYMGALYYNSDGEVTGVYFNGNFYEWNTKGTLKGSNWYDFANKKTLVADVMDYIQKNDKMEVVMEIYGVSERQSLSYSVMFAKAFYDVTITGEGVAYYLDGLRFPTGVYSLAEGKYTLVMEVLPGYEGTPTASGVVDGVFEVTGKMTIEVTGVTKIDPRSVRLIGAGFYQDADQARLAMQALGSTYAMGVDMNTMFVVYEQFGYGTSKMQGVVTYNGNTIFSEDLLDKDGIRTWLFSDMNQVKEKFVNGGKYTISIFSGTDSILTVDVYVTIAPEPVMYKVTLVSAGEITVMAGETITLPTLSRLGETFIGWSETKGGTYGIQGFYTPTSDIELHPVFATVKTYGVSTDYTGTDVTLAYNRSITDGSFGLLVVTKKDPKVAYEITLTNASLAMLGEGSYMIVGATGDVKISVTVTTMEPSGFESFGILGALADNKGFRVQMKAKDMGGLFGGNVVLTYTYSVERSGETFYASKNSDPVAVAEGVDLWTNDYKPTEGTMYYAYATYTYTSGTTDYKFQTLGVVAPSIPSVTP